MTDNLLAKYTNGNCTEEGIHLRFRLCTRCSFYFRGDCCNLDQEIIKVLNECTDNYWFCLTSTKSPLNAVFIDKDIDERYKTCLDSMEERFANLESEQFGTKNSVKILEDTLKRNNSAVTRCMDMVDSSNERVNTLKKVSNESSKTESTHTIEVNNKENSNTNQKQDKPVVKNQLKDWKSRENNVSIYNIPGTNFVNSNNTTANLLSKLKLSIADLYEITYERAI